MKKTKAIIIIIFLSIVCLNIQMTSAYNEVNLFKDVLEKTNSNVLEGGITVFFESEDKDINICLNLLQELGMYNEDNVKVVQNDGVYRLEFNFEYVKGFVQNINNCSSIVLSITNIDNIDELTILEDKITNILQRECKNIKHYRYIKAELPENSIESTEKEVLKILNDKNAININTIKINNGYSVNAYTAKYQPIKSGNKLVDFHCIVCSYSSGNYIIIGTPEIRIMY